MPNSPRPSSPVWLPIFALLLAMASLQLGAALAKTLFTSVGAQGATSLRLLFSALALLCFFRPWRTQLAPGAWRIITLYGLALAGMNFLFYMAIRTVPLGVAVALEFTGPLAVAVLSARRLAHFLWIGVACAGLLALVPWNAAAAQALDPVGVLYALGAALCWALYIVFGQRAGTRHGPRHCCAGRQHCRYRRVAGRP
ncbi:hypothetical protein PSTG_18662 [Puccinia striiformis f. sp. tritici PST-78]|uniref:EamA domain-containing protein n=1 Tax=Puccinia striiformis f. sp. tritici PST-78 TaxID=1165861 RepID=A0A0L0UMF8_9BASI|nr:hypothetical protein PSTG_18662 [Puccinia striiformis f. sp. tritici PST-78]